VNRAYAEVIGDPIAHSKSPLIHGFWLDKLGIDAEYRRCHVRPDELAGYFAARRDDADWRGCNVTIPHKQAVMPFLDRIEEAGRQVGAVNTVWRDTDGQLVGTNTDVDGVGEALQDAPDLAGADVVVIGAGGAARAAFAHLAGLQCASVRVVARNHAKAAATLAEFALPVRFTGFDDVTALRNAALVINAAQLGMTGQEPMPAAILDGLAQTAPDCVVFDMVYAPRDTELLKHAAIAGRQTSGGLTMLVGQARTAFERFFGQVPSRQDDPELQEILTS